MRCGLPPDAPAAPRGEAREPHGGAGLRARDHPHARPPARRPAQPRAPGRARPRLRSGPGLLAHGRTELPEEPLRAAALLDRAARARLWDAARPPPLFFAAKGAAGAVLARAGPCRHLPPRQRARPALHPGRERRAAPRRRRARPASASSIPTWRRRFAIDVPCAVFELDLDACLRLAPEAPRYREPSRVPAVRRDLAVLLDRAQPRRRRARSDPQDRGVESSRPQRSSTDTRARASRAGKVSVAFRLVFQRADRTLHRRRGGGRRPSDRRHARASGSAASCAEPATRVSERRRGEQ